MLHYGKLETEQQQQQQQAREEEEDQRDTTEDAFCGLQCGDSLAIAANHLLGEDVFGIKKLLRRTLIALGKDTPPGKAGERRM